MGTPKNSVFSIYIWRVGGGDNGVIKVRCALRPQVQMNADSVAGEESSGVEGGIMG